MQHDKSGQGLIDGRLKCEPKNITRRLIAASRSCEKESMICLKSRQV